MEALLMVVAGIGLLAGGGEVLIRGALAAARRAQVSPLLAGLVIVGFGTSAPELFVSVDAVLHDNPDVAVGNVVGSNIANILLILGICAVIQPLAVNPTALRRDGAAMLTATLLVVALGVGGMIGRFDASLLLAAFAAYLAWAYLSDLRADDAGAGMHRAEAEEVSALPTSVPGMIVAVVGGLGLVIGGSRLLVTGAVELAAAAGVPQAVVGLTLVAVGTSLPELAVSVMAAIRRHADVAVGNILGSNVFNATAILAAAGLVHPLPLPARVMAFDQWVMLGAAVLLLVFLRTGLRLSRAEGTVLLALYGGYLGVTFTILAR